MRPASSFGGGFGIRWDPRTWSTRLAIVTFALSVLLMGAHHLPTSFAILLQDVFIFTPADVRTGSLWQLVSYVFIDADPMGLLFAVYALLVFGGDVEARTGPRAFLGWFFGLGAAASLVTVALSFVWHTLEPLPYDGASVVGLGLLVVWVALNRGAVINFFMVLPMKAEVMLYLSLGLLVLYSIRFSPAMFVPQFAVFGVGELATRSGFDFSPRRAYLKYRAWQIDRELRKRARKFTVISGGDSEPGSDDDKGPGPNGYLN
jgi:membrane associated rhomboid family serine protease